MIVYFSIERKKKKTIISFFFSSLPFLIKSTNELLNIIENLSNVIKYFLCILTCNHLSIQGFSIAYLTIEEKRNGIGKQLTRPLHYARHASLRCIYLVFLSL